MADFDAIVVGAGCAGSVAAYELAQAGKSVLLVERGNYAGAKNMTGGRIYTHSLEKVFPDFRNDAPLERRVTHERITLLTDDASTTIDFSSNDMKAEGQESYTVLRAPFDQWLAGKAEEAGAEVICGIPVEDLIKDEQGRVLGVIAGEDEITADVTIIADGANSLLAPKATGAPRPTPAQMGVGVKQVFELSAGVITDRILAESDEDGMAWMFVGDCTKGQFGGGIVYTNRSSISIGVVAGLAGFQSGDGASICEMFEALKSHPSVAPLLKGAQLVEHSGHMVPEGGFSAMPATYTDGALIVGDAGMMCLNLGYIVRGMDYAIAAGQIAGKAAAEALDAGDTSKAGLKRYQDMLDASFVMKDLKLHAAAPEFLEGFDRMFAEYPAAAREILNKMFIVDGAPDLPLKDKVMPAVKSLGYMNLFKDGKGALKAL